MSLPNDISRCVGRTALTPTAPVCPQREECQRYTVLKDNPDCALFSVAMYLCQTAEFERRIPVSSMGPGGPFSPGREFAAPGVFSGG